MGLLYSIGIRVVNFLVFFFLIVLLPGLPPKPHFGFKEFNVTPSRELNGPLELNNHLDNAERLLDGRVYGPECLIERDNEIFASIHGGEVIKITADHITHVAKFGQPCENTYEEEKCGRPLGLAFDTIGNNIIVSDAYYGIWQVDITNGKKKLLISPYQELEGTIRRPAKLFNSVAVAKNGDIYWTDSSSDYTIENGFYSMLTNPSGRLFHYKRATNESSLLIDELFFANGLALSPNEDFVVVSETGGCRLLKYHLKGSKKGQSEVFIDGVPGTPDNITPDKDGIWVPLVMARDSEHPGIFQVLAPHPLIRTFILRLFSLFNIPFRFFNNAFPNTYTQKVLHYSGNFESGKGILPKRTTILRIDWNGNIIGSLHGFDKSVQFVSHVLELGDSLFLGSPFNRYLAKVKLPRGPQVKVRNVRYDPEPEKKPATKTTAKPATIKTTAKPATTTTTAKPTTTTTTAKPTTTTTTAKPTTTTTAKPTTTTTPKPTTTTPKPATPTTPKPTTAKSTAKPATAKTTEKPTTAKTTAKPATDREVPKTPAPIKEEVPKDTKPPQPPKLKVIKKGGEQGEL